MAKARMKGVCIDGGCIVEVMNRLYNVLSIMGEATTKMELSVMEEICLAKTSLDPRILPQTPNTYEI